MKITNTFPLASLATLLLSPISTASSTPLNCSIETIQSLLLTSNSTNDSTGTTTAVAFAYRIDSNASLSAFESVIGTNLQQDLSNVCAAKINVSTTTGSNYNFGIFLPDTWNERLMVAAPNGGIDWRSMSAGVKYGFATLSSNAGHDGLDQEADWVTPESLIDWGWRAVHESTVTGKSLLKTWYGGTTTTTTTTTGSKYTYFTGCSVGGRHALKQLQMFPEDYDGVMAGAPAWWTTHLQLWNLKQTTYQAPANSSHTIPESMFDVIGDEVIRQCDPQDGLVDLVISDPIGCNFNPLTLACSLGNSTSECLNSEQMKTLYKIYNDWVDVNQTYVFSHLLYGSEASWTSNIGDGTDGTIGQQLWYIQNLMGLTDFEWQDLDYDTVLLAEKLNPGNATADDFDLSPFYNRGGKLIHWHGYSDGIVAPGASIYYYNHVTETLLPQGIDMDEFYRMFLVPGLEHCTGTPSNMDAPWYIAGPTQASQFTFVPDNVVDNTVHDSMLSLMAWVENSTAPDYIVATKFFNDSNPITLKKNRRICPYPQQAKLAAGGNSSEEDYWSCESLY